jgi:hypothetical protein
MHQHNNLMLNQDKLNGQIIFLYVTCIQFTLLFTKHTIQNKIPLP